MNEPMNALERIAEELEYSELLDAAAKATDSTERLTLVATFAISATSGNKYRGSRKPLCVLLLPLVRLKLDTDLRPIFLQQPAPRRDVRVRSSGQGCVFSLSSRTLY